jgi:23S rRNA (guanosine2251-2'-O)-methyltransferase
MSVTHSHQGVITLAAAHDYASISDILEEARSRGEEPLIVICDELTDPHNLGAILRSAECAGAHGLITPLKNSAPVNAEAIRSSAGALTTIPVCRVGSLRNTAKQLQLEGFQVVAATEKSRKLLYDADFRKPTVIVMGSEDTGISKELLKLCDEQLAIPLIGHIESLNVSAAAAVMLFEVVRQRIG